MKIYLPLEFSGGNRGCEGIAKGTAAILKIPKENLIGLSCDAELDKKLGTGKVMTLVNERQVSFSWKVYRKFYTILCKENTAKQLNFWHGYHWFIDNIQKEDVVLSSGGDTLCYEDNNITVFVNNYCYDKGIKSILWGCSFGKENVTPNKLKSLKKFAAIYTRESLSYETMKELGLKNVYCYPDPAFALNPEKCRLPKCFDHDVVGLNISKYVSNTGFCDSLFGKNLKLLIDYILKTTDMNVLLIPHVFWSSEDDQTISSQLLEEYKDNSRVQLLDGNRLNYLQLRYVISKCRFYVGARTHSVISAYSTCVPAVALGYSIKALGIAKDVGMDPCTVVDSKHFTSETQILEAFRYLQENEQSICQHLMEFMPQYISRVWDARKLVSESRRC